MIESLSLVEIALWICAISGTLFTAYSFAVFILRKIDNLIRLSLSIIFLATGMLFFSAVGSILSGRAAHFTIMGCAIIVLLSIVGMIFVYLLYKSARKEWDKLESQEEL